MPRRAQWQLIQCKNALWRRSNHFFSLQKGVHSLAEHSEFHLLSKNSILWQHSCGLLNASATQLHPMVALPGFLHPGGQKQLQHGHWDTPRPLISSFNPQLDQCGCWTKDPDTGGWLEGSSSECFGSLIQTSRSWSCPQLIWFSLGAFHKVRSKTQPWSNQQWQKGRAHFSLARHSQRMSCPHPHSSPTLD